MWASGLGQRVTETRRARLGGVGSGEEGPSHLSSAPTSGDQARPPPPATHLQRQNATVDAAGTQSLLQRRVLGEGRAEGLSPSGVAAVDWTPWGGRENWKERSGSGDEQIWEGDELERSTQQGESGCWGSVGEGGELGAVGTHTRAWGRGEGSIMALLQVRPGAACHMSCFEEEALLWQRL